jgi:hypothetical protein
MGAELSTQPVDCVVRETQSESCYESEDSWTFTEVHGRTVVVFDWDDTLLCSSAVRGSFWNRLQLKELEIAIESILRRAMELGETMIVTNGNRTWVQDSAQRFLPGLLPILAQVRVVSARGLFEEMYPGDPFMWKHAAFEHLLMKERHFPAEPGLNLIALGDQFPEIDAARHVRHLIGGSSLVKTIKFREAPSVSELLGQLGRAELALDSIVLGKASQSLGLVQREASDRMASSAAAWRLAPEEECVQECTDSMGCVSPLSCAGPMPTIKDVMGLLA